MKKSNTGERLRQIMRERNMKQIDILSAVLPYCKKYNVKMNRSDISQYVNGKVEPNQPKLTALSQALNVSETWLMGYDDSGTKDVFSIPNILPIKKQRIPLLGEIAAGQPIFAEQDYDAYIDIDSHIHADFALKVKGDSMAPKLLDGDTVFIRKQSDVRDGQIAAVVVDDSATLKRVYHTRNGVQLISYNSDYPPMLYTQENSDVIIILGLAVGLYRGL